MRSIIIFASGQGSNAAAIIQYFKPRPEVRIRAIVCNNPQAGVIQLAEQQGIPCLMTDRAMFKSEALAEQLRELGPDLVVLAGFLWKIPGSLIRAFPHKIINLHPALLPKYGGKGMYGRYVHEAVKAAGEKESGITIHLVNENYDEGAVLLQAYCPVRSADTPDDIARRIHHLEHFYLPRLIDFLLFHERP
ncbi:MAG TPA: phosphoribosylglycinamide formyltransferase [Edaphocola sp.]|nr:phosphoribosylglycinamide formyltransferase [Edaphocola sp.]